MEVTVGFDNDWTSVLMAGNLMAFLVKAKYK
jgi:hypothetical protein